MFTFKIHCYEWRRPEPGPITCSPWKLSCYCSKSNCSWKIRAMSLKNFPKGNIHFNKIIPTLFLGYWKVKKPISNQRILLSVWTYHHFLLGLTPNFLLGLTITFYFDLPSLSAGSYPQLFAWTYHHFLLGLTITFYFDLPSLSAGSYPQLFVWTYHQNLLRLTITFC